MTQRPSRRSLPSRVRRALLRAPLAAPTALSLVGLSADAAACPYCSLSQGVETLAYILGFLLIPYVIVLGTWWWMKRVLASEQEA